MEHTYILVLHAPCFRPISKVGNILVVDEPQLHDAHYQASRSATADDSLTTS